MFEITIKGSTITELAGNLQILAAHYATAETGGTVTKTRPAKAEPRALADPKPAPVPADDFDPDKEDSPPQPMPETARAVVDAGTGQPVAAPAPAEELVKQMTFDDVKAAAAKLAAKDTPTLAGILKKYGAAKLSEVSKDKLGDFAGDVLEALG